MDIYMGLIVLLVVLKQLQGAMHGLVLCTWLDMVCIEPRLVHECTKLFTNTCGWFCFFFYRYGFWEAPGMTQTHHQCRKKKKTFTQSPWILHHQTCGIPVISYLLSPGGGKVGVVGTFSSVTSPKNRLYNQR